MFGGSDLQFDRSWNDSTFWLSQDPMTESKNSGFPRLCFTVKETAEMLGNVSDKTIYRLLKRGKLEAPSALRHKLITAASIQAFIGLPEKEVR